MDNSSDFREIRISTDELTGLLDKQAFYECAQDLINSAGEDNEYAFIFFDLENFKFYNVNYGYELGDELLISIGYIIKDVFQGQLISRFSGDHFVVCANSVQIVPSINNIRDRIKLIQKSVNVELKAGIYIYDGEENDVIRCCDRARMACVSIKKKYDVAFRFYDDDLGGSLQRKQEILDSLDEAIEKKYIKVFYQPIVRTLTGEVCGWEALVRWIDPNKGMVFPNEFIPVLEEYRLIAKVDAFVMEEVLSRFHSAVVERNNHVPVSINLSRIDFEVLDVVSLINQLVKKYNIPKNMFHLEVTESALTKDAGFITEQIKKLRDQGYIVWMDDFGSGYSSLNLLKNYEFDLIKIDMDFLSQFDETDNGKIILRHIVSMIKNLNIHTLAEGVETKEQYDFLKSIGCEMIQGYLIGRPMPYMESLECIKKDGRKLESSEDRFFFEELGCVDILRQNPLQNIANTEIENPLPLAIGVCTKGVWDIIYTNSSFRELMRMFRFEEIDEVQDMLNDKGHRKWARNKDFNEICAHSRETETPASIDYIVEGHIVNLRARYLCSANGEEKNAYLVSLRLLSRFLTSDNDSRITAISRAMLTKYECVDLFGIGNNYFENIFLNDSRLHVNYTGQKPKDVLNAIRDTLVHPDDKKYFDELMDLDTIEKRINDEVSGTIIGFIRVKNARKTFIWKTISLSIVHFEGYDVMLSCVSESPNEIARRMTAATSVAVTQYEDMLESHENAVIPRPEDVLQMLPMGVFWKDANRKFLGANQMFLDYFGFQSLESILGKTDEDMGWHINPEPFKKDEESVIKEGNIIENVHGECIVKGQVRHIVANKRPCYVDRKIVGLIGYFVDITKELEKQSEMENLINTDALTGLYNRRSFEEVVGKYKEQYEKKKTDFAICLLDIDKFKQINDMYGHDVGDDVLREVAKVLAKVASESSVVFRFGGDEFIVLHQQKSRSEMESIKQEIDSGIAKLEKIGKVQMTVRLSKGMAFYSDYENIGKCLDAADKGMYADKESKQKKKKINKNKT
ncbi:diguanylate cyclase (GGDEF) domain-containing protein [Pseudobutyrivibrio sp. YE44]|uniref:EAL domain-containing protein n=1 Tax=Pseudobutyrivibrio sp. YE44 TaxID=1520802 RepID=UPI00088A48FD|nr:EAL domain-containing protein [Pseudobutyrivibrio sp. YE44]SDB37784.1 diguanylate cyclase (GGDEF) domain-containing protein [Pseudobutyrivibrio sp. YE44]